MKNRSDSGSPALYAALAEELLVNEFLGKYSTDISDRIAVSTDNSLYQIIPEMIIRPDTIEEAEKAVRLLSESRFSSLNIVVRGGGTGTNGQSLNKSVVLDLGRHLNRIREINLEEGWVDVDAGIILASLNEQLAGYNMFFAPTTSTSNRCSIGGMINTDAAGKGSRIYGKTSDHVLALDILLITGERIWIEPDNISRLANSTRDRLCRKIYEICMSRRNLVKSTFPRLNRRLSGYDLETSVSEDGTINPVRIICGSEGTLGIVLGARLKLTPVPKYKRLVVLAYTDFIDAVSSATDILPFQPAAIETIDDVIQKKALQGPLGQLLPSVFHASDNMSGPPICNFVEFTGDDEETVSRQAADLIEFTKKSKKIIAVHLVTSPSEQTAFWNARKAAVGLLADCPPGPQPAAFVEDCVVPPENLPQFLTEFRQLLDTHRTAYGMFGHVDVGCIHVRPAINQNKKDVTRQVRLISDEVQKIVRKYNGLLWGEHGKGFRGEYLEETVGHELYTAMREIKSLFDPEGRLNPGKLASPLTEAALPLTKIDEAPTRGGRNRQVPDNYRLDSFSDAFRCNGNAQCLNATLTTPMCPSFKATGDYRYSPKGRSDLLREWLRLRETDDRKNLEYEKEIYPVLDACLSCKACTSSCPVHIDIPELKSRFLESYHQRHFRPVRDYCFAQLEKWSERISRHPFVANIIMRNPFARFVTKHIGIVDAPAASSPSIHKKLAGRHAQIWTPAELISALESGRLSGPPEQDRKYSPVILVDGFTIAYDAGSLEDIYVGLCNLGFYPFFVYAGQSGKALHVKGFRNEFKQVARRHVKELDVLIRLKQPIVVAEPSYLATIEKDYTAVGEIIKLTKISTLHQYLKQHIDYISERKAEKLEKKARYFPHCTEKTSTPDIGLAWKEILLAAGIEIQIANTGCCGMSGAFGHEYPHQKSSHKLYDLTWKDEVIDAGEQTILASGFSCRCQVKRFGSRESFHPLHLVAKR